MLRVEEPDANGAGYRKNEKLEDQVSPESEDGAHTRAHQQQAECREPDGATFARARAAHRDALVNDEEHEGRYEE
jgi:hypothetical protein